VVRWCNVITAPTASNPCQPTGVVVTYLPLSQKQTVGPSRTAVKASIQVRVRFALLAFALSGPRRLCRAEAEPVRASRLIESGQREQGLACFAEQADWSRPAHVSASIT